MLLLNCCHVQRAEEGQLRKKSTQSIVNGCRSITDNSMQRQTTRSMTDNSLQRRTASSPGRQSSKGSGSGSNVGIGSVAAGEVKPEDVLWVTETDASVTDGSPVAGKASKVQETMDDADGQQWCSKERNAATLFKQLDNDGDGIITQAELALAFSKGLLGKPSQQHKALPAKLSEKHSPRKGQEAGKKHGPIGKEQPHSRRSNTTGHCIESSKEIMPFRKQKLQRQDAFSRRKSVTCMEGYLDGAGADATAASAAAAAPTLCRKSTQHLFADPSQTFIVLDWDDTLFPTTYVRDDMNLSWKTPMKNQPLPSREKNEISQNLQRCSDKCCSLLEDACCSGKVVLVTLARSPWVTTSCDNFYPAVGEFIKAMGIPVIYAQECEEVDYDMLAMSSSAVEEKQWAQVKGRAIAKQLQEFYSQYAGQSWKNIISIGDSDFERLGTQQATQDYMRQNGINRSRTVELKGHVYKVRTKTFKMLDEPTVEELAVELALVQKWLPCMTRLDNSFDVNLSDLDDPAVLRRIERTLHGGTTNSKAR